jgi:hypothetical protein
MRVIVNEIADLRLDARGFQQLMTTGLGLLRGRQRSGLGLSEGLSEGVDGRSEFSEGFPCVILVTWIFRRGDRQGGFLHGRHLGRAYT